MAKAPQFGSSQDVADHFGISAKKARALHRKAVRAAGGTIGKDTPGKGKRYGKDVFAIMAENVEAALSSNDESAEADAPQA